MNKSKIIFILLILITFITLIGCTELIPNYKELNEDELKYSGEWQSSDSQYLLIRPSGSGDYEGFSGAMSISIDGGMVDINNNILKISIFTINKEFVITKEPYQENGKTVLELDNKKFIKTL